MRVRNIVIAICVLLSLAACDDTARYRRKLEKGKEYAGQSPITESKQIGFSYVTESDELRRLDEQLGIAAYLEPYSLEVERILALIPFVHDLVEWDGSAPWPQGELNTLNILEHAETTGQGVNCRMMAIILQEVYLAAGYPARMVSCIPLDPEDNDSHVIVAVWSETLGSWLWADPSFNAYLTDAAGRPVGLQEVRSGLLEDTKYRLNPEAEIRGKPLTEKFYLDYYMTKNLYALISPLEATYGYEGSPGRRYSTLLLPAIEYEKVSDPVREYTFRESEWTQYLISDPELFWAPPDR